MHLAPVSFDTQMIKGEILQYCKDLIASIKNNHSLVEQYFHSALLGDEGLKHHTLQPRYFILENSPPEELSLTSLKSLLSGTANQPWAAKLQGIDS